MEQVRKKLHAEYAYRKGIDGTGVTVAVLDTGIIRHPDFGDRILEYKNFTSHKHGYIDDNGHGTHVAGIIAGNGVKSKGRYMGMAPGASLVIGKILDQKGNGNTDQILKAIQYVIEKKDIYGIRILNISVGMMPDAGSTEKTELINAVEQAWRAGIIVVAAAGNNGPAPSSVTIPGTCKSIITVGSVETDVRKMKRGKETLYSGRGPTDQCVVKPEILAPGNTIRSCSANGSGYENKSGTSMSAPVIAGALALLLQKEPKLTPVQVKLRLYERCVVLPEYRNMPHWGVVYMDRLLG